MAFVSLQLVVRHDLSGQEGMVTVHWHGTDDSLHEWRLELPSERIPHLVEAISAVVSREFVEADSDEEEDHVRGEG